MRKQPRLGSALVEFTLVSIPLIFVLISLAEMARAMWTFDTLTFAVKEGVRYAAVHGENCDISPNACTVTVAQVADRIHSTGVGLIASNLNLTFSTSAGTLRCGLSDCLANQSRWPAAPGDTRGSDIEIAATYSFQSLMCMFWPGTGEGVIFGMYTFPAAARETIQF